MRFNIQDELSMLRLSTIEVSYQYELREEAKLKIRSNPRGREKQVTNNGKEKQTIEVDFDQRIPRRGNGSKEFKGTYFKCGGIGHRNFQCYEGSSKNMRKQNLVAHKEKTTDEFVVNEAEPKI